LFTYLRLDSLWNYFLTDSAITTQNVIIDAEDKSNLNRYQIKTNWNINSSLSSFDEKSLYFSVVYSPRSGAECKATNDCRTAVAFYSPVRFLVLFCFTSRKRLLELYEA